MLIKNDSEIFQRNMRVNAFFSPHHRLLYVATPKVACTAFKWWFAELVGVRTSIAQTNVSLESDPELVIHDTFARVAPEFTGANEKGLNEALSSPDYFRFCLVRNPYVRAFSAWQSKWLIREPLQGAAYQNAQEDHAINSLADIRASFEAFLRAVAEVTDPAIHDVHIAPQVMLLDPNEVSYHVISHIEDPADLLKALADRIGPEFHNPLAGLRANVSLLPYSSAWISDIAASIICKIYACDFETFGYDWEVPPGEKSLTDSALVIALRSIKLLRGRNARIGELISRVSGGTTESGQLEARVYLSERVNDVAQAYGENRGASAVYDWNGEETMIDLVLPNDLGPLARLRLDISNAPAAVALYEISIHQAGGEEIWHWDGACDVFVSPGGVVCLPGERGAMLLCLNDDPQFDLAIPQAILALVRGGAVLRLRLRAMPLLDELPVVLAGMQAKTRPPLPALAGMHLPAGLGGHLEELAGLLKTQISRKNATISVQQSEIETLRVRQQVLYEQLIRAEAQLELLKEFALSEAGGRLERL